MHAEPIGIQQVHRGFSLRIVKSHRLLILFFALITLIGSYTATLQSLDELTYDIFVRFLPNLESASRSLVLAIDEKAIEQFGPWPWPRERLAQIIKQLEKLKAGAIGIVLPLDQPQSLSVPDTYQSLLESTDSKTRETVTAIIDKLDPDAIFTDTLVSSERVILAVPYWREQRGLIEPMRQDLSMILRPIESQSRTTAWQDIANILNAPPPIKIHIGRPPVANFALSAKGVGLARFGRAEEKMLTEALAVKHDAKYVPAFALLVAAQTVGVNFEDILVIPNFGIRFGAGIYRTDSELQYHPKPSFDSEGEPSRITSISAADLLNNKVKSSDIKGKAVLVGFTAPGNAPTIIGPGGMQVTPVGWSAHVVDSLLAGTSINSPYWALGLQRGLIIAFTVYLMFLPTLLRGRIGQIVSLMLALVALNVSLILLMVQSVWLPLTLPALYVLTAHGLLTFYHRIYSVINTQRNEASDAYRELALNLHAQGKLDQALSSLKKCAVSEGVLDMLYTIALDFERRRQFGKAISVYDYMSRFDAKFRDIQERKARHQAVPANTLLNGNGPSNLTSTLVVDDSKVEKPVLGRYEIDKELGRGAMGMVYLGKDPKIGRVVAIKTLSFTEEFEGEQLEEIRKRFFFEAEAAGRLNHPNIVTIYDAGEEHDLAYIAMDFIEGDSLDLYTAPKNLLPKQEVFVIGVTVAEALDYAHNKNIVHRDIKPSNIIYNRDNGTLKVTDFGVACVMDNSKTRTGMVLGSPSYMSPEQLAAKKVDGRSDVFSLGVTLYQLFTGQLPFIADSMAQLAYKITNEKPIGIRKVRHDLPPCLTRIINKTLEKDPKNRFADGASLADALKRCGGNK